MTRVAAALAGALTLAVTSSKAQQNVLRGGVTIVPIDVRAFDRQGRPVTDLTAHEFAIFEDGVRQQIAHFSTLAFSPDGVAAPAVTPGTAPPPSSSTPGTNGPLRPQPSRLYLIVLGRGRRQVPNKGVDGVLHFVRHRLLAQDRVALLAYNRAIAFTTDHESLVPILERYARAHEAIESRLAVHFSGLAGVYQVAEFPAALQTDIDAIFGGPAAAAGTTVPAMENRSRSDADYRRRVADVLIGDPSASLADRVEAAVEDLPFDTFVAETAKDGLDIGNINAAIDYLRHVDGEKHIVYVGSGGFTTSAFAGTLESLARAASHARVALDIVHTGGIKFRCRTSEPETIAMKIE